MVHTVGIVGVNGNVGSPAAKLLVKAAEEGKIKLVIFHREGSTPKGLSPGKHVELKVLNFDDPADKLEAAVEGINVFISAVGFGAIPQEPNLVDALAKSPDLVTYIPSTYSTTWDPEDYKDPQLAPVLNFIHMGWERAKEKQIGITAIYTGVFDSYWFQTGFVGSPLKGNTIWANKMQLQNRIPITSEYFLSGTFCAGNGLALEHLASAITRIAIADPQSVKNREYSVVTFWPTGQELVDLYTKLNGEKCQIKDFTKEDRDTQMADAANFGPAKVGYWDRWESGRWGYESDGKIKDENYSGPSLEQLGRMFS